jgi:3-oxoacid CoA-transferase
MPTCFLFAPALLVHAFLSPFVQGTLAERLRAGGAGIAAFFTPTAYGTVIQEGGAPVQYNKDGTIKVASEPKETRDYNGRNYVLEEGITGDYGLVKAWRGDTLGNLQFRGTAKNFNPECAAAGKITIAEVEELVEPGVIAPDQVDVPSIYVQRIYEGKHEKRIEKRTVAKPPAADDDAAGAANPAEMSSRERIVRRAALELSDGMYVNLGIGIPTMASNYLPPGATIHMQVCNSCSPMH